MAKRGCLSNNSYNIHNILIALRKKYKPDSSAIFNISLMRITNVTSCCNYKCN